MRVVPKIFASAILVFAALTQSAVGQEWARKMFSTTHHDFGTVARGAKSEFRFQFKNLYKEDIHVASIRSSCGCTTPKILTNTLKTHDTGEILAVFNTQAFLGSRTAVLTLVIDKPYYAEVQLNIKGYIRGDVVLNPGGVQFGALDQGEIKEKTINLEYAGRNDWQIVDVRTANPHLQAELNETRRGGGRVGYQLKVRLAEDAPTGYLQDQLVVVTNDRNLSRFPIPVEGKVESAVSVSPSPLFVGVVQPGQEVTKKLVVRAKKPFRVLSVTCDDDCFQYQGNASLEEAKALHLIPITFKADEVGKFSGTIHIETDLGEGIIPDVAASAEVVDTVQ
ncbi:MAG: DUF1573 domain-containing protein [Pirellulales bacterium]|nr:DUF1573 domain-containing protein [Pirellulales bacterium]